MVSESGGEMGGEDTIRREEVRTGGEKRPELAY
jgi:hypothetical protein